MEGQKPYFYEDEIELIDILRVIWRWKTVIILTAALAAIAAAVIVNVRYPARTGSRAILSLSFPGIEQGRNPDDTVFKKEQLVTPAIVRHAAGQVAGVDADLLLAEWQGLITVQAIIPEEIKQEQDQKAFFPDSFELTVYCSTGEGKPVLSRQQSQHMLEALVEAYKGAFAGQFIEVSLVTPQFFIDGLKPLEAVEVIEQRADYLLAAFKPEALREKAPSFRADVLRYLSEKEQESIDHIRYEVSIIKDILIPDVAGRVLDFYGDAEVAKKYLALTDSKAKKLIEAEATEAMITQLPSPLRKGVSEDVILDSPVMENLSRMDVRKYLVEKALDARTEAGRLKVERNALRVDGGALTEAQTEELRKLLDGLKGGLVDSGQRANAIYSAAMREELSDAIRKVTPIRTADGREVNLPLTMTLSALAAFAAAVFLALFIEYLKKAGKTPASA